MLGIWKCEHLVEHRTYFEYIRNTVIIIEANQLPNLLFKWIIFTLQYMYQKVKPFVPTAIYFTPSDVSEDFSQWLDSPFLPRIFFLTLLKQNLKHLILYCSHIQGGKLHYKARLL